MTDNPLLRPHVKIYDTTGWFAVPVADFDDVVQAWRAGLGTYEGVTIWGGRFVVDCNQINSVCEITALWLACDADEKAKVAPATPTQTA